MRDRSQAHRKNAEVQNAVKRVSRRECSVKSMFEQLSSNGDIRAGCGEPYQTADGITVIPVAKPTGIFVVRVGEATWVPAIDANRAALIGALTGLLAAVIGTLAVLRQPPWPRITVTENR
jgi:hypothetical protein